MSAQTEHVSVETLRRRVGKLTQRVVRAHFQKLAKEMCVLVPVTHVDLHASIAL
jgi:hypothetical protein